MADFVLLHHRVLADLVPMVGVTISKATRPIRLKNKTSPTGEWETWDDRRRRPSENWPDSKGEFHRCASSSTPRRLKRDEFHFTQLCKVKPLVLYKYVSADLNPATTGDYTSLHASQGCLGYLWTSACTCGWFFLLCKELKGHDSMAEGRKQKLVRQLSVFSSHSFYLNKVKGRACEVRTIPEPVLDVGRLQGWSQATFWRSAFKESCACELLQRFMLFWAETNL